MLKKLTWCISKLFWSLNSRLSKLKLNFSKLKLTFLKCIDFKCWKAWINIFLFGKVKLFARNLALSNQFKLQCIIKWPTHRWNFSAIRFIFFLLLSLCRRNHKCGSLVVAIKVMYESAAVLWGHQSKTQPKSLVRFTSGAFIIGLTDFIAPCAMGKEPFPLRLHARPSNDLYRLPRSIPSCAI